MKTLLIGSAALLLAIGQIIAADEKPKSIKDVMVEGHKGKTPLCAKASKGEASKEEAEKLLALYTDMAKNEPKKGDKEEWKKKCEALITASKALVADQKDNAAYKAAVNCKACHMIYK